MTLLACEHLTRKFKDQVILNDVSFTIVQNERIALVGKNGIGKTTLLEILAGKQEAETGTVNRPRACIIDYIEQEKTDYLDMSLFEFVAESRADLLAMRGDIQQIEHYLEDNPGDADQLARLGDLQHRFETDGGFDFENEIAS
ncbi:MAG: ATP-binding cassette domain-containing protein, partial [candidate division Zixibacteria bacterium]|nr:ATP-binding cassette domain-containing protein [candidate division Zixibacteria bacterium]